MQHRIPRQPDQDPGPAPRRPDNDVGLSAELAAALAAARRRALRDGDRQIDSAHLLHALVESDPQARAAFGEGPHVARLLGYLVQRSIGYGLRWQTGVENAPAVAPAGETSTARPRALVSAAPAGVQAEDFSPLAAEALARAAAAAARRDGGPARGTDLLAALLAEPGARAVEVLTHAGIDAAEPAARLRDPLDGVEDRLEGSSR
ncbi:Clp protease N-terminal domain-containing protein [Streptomyces mangrovisoli]|uniref:Peptidase n=1 Tax=Streptomyces mangrovisoli TaxID=1428628 RepID=A0A1J4NXA9_9ACTN|nr:Clp protease N-terminal domain-containing protein [Streptomyces mangrovisoli]OIJ66952.1 hypothetical protein WN71_016185 [Streptomyces mangrovisoli]